jgi:magnesium-transporting ATPase (P-type)
VAHRDLGEPERDATQDELEHDLEPVGLLGFADPPRPQAAASSARARPACAR